MAREQKDTGRHQSGPGKAIPKQGDIVPGETKPRRSKVGSLEFEEVLAASRRISHSLLNVFEEKKPIATFVADVDTVFGDAKKTGVQRLKEKMDIDAPLFVLDGTYREEVVSRPLIGRKVAVLARHCIVQKREQLRQIHSHLKY